MRLFRIFVIILFANIIGHCQSIEGIWLGNYGYNIDQDTDTLNIDVERRSYLFDFYGDSKFLIYNSSGEHLIFEYEKLSSGLFRAMGPDPEKSTFLLEIIDKNRLRFYPERINENTISEVIFLDKLNSKTINFDKDSLTSTLSSSAWVLNKDYSEFYFEFDDMKEKRVIVNSNYSEIHKTSFGLIEYKGNFFFAFRAGLYGEVMIQLNDYDGENFISFAHNMELFDESINPSTITLKREGFSSKAEYGKRSNIIVGKWMADVTDWKKLRIKFDDSSPTTYENLSNWLRIDSVISNQYQLEFNADSTYQFINIGKFVQNKEVKSTSDTLYGSWSLSPTLKYIEIVIHNPGYIDYEGRFIEIHSLDERTAEFGLEAAYPSLQDGLHSEFTFEKLE